MLAAMMYSLEAPVVENIRFPQHNYLLAIRAPDVAARTLPGQFVMAAELDEILPFPLLKRALAVYSVRPEKGSPAIITLLLKVIGPGTRRLASLQPGDTVSLIGPLGNGFNLDLGRGKVNLLVAGGIGIASFYLLAHALRERGEEVHLLYGGRTADDLVGLEDFHSLRVPATVTTEDGSLGRKGLVTLGLEKYLRDFPPDKMVIFTCGPNRMMEAVSSLAAAHGVRCQISVEAKMACGFGVCLGCSVKTVDSFRLACRNGPVFDASEFVWEDSANA